MAFPIQHSPPGSLDKYNQTSCAICLDDLARDKIIKLKCGHIFHKACQAKWPDRCALCLTPLNERASALSRVAHPDNSLRETFINGDVWQIIVAAMLNQFANRF
jgi:hypothetical protein